MSKQPVSNQPGALNDEMTATPQDMQSINAGQLSTSGTSDLEVLLSPDYQATHPALDMSPSAVQARMFLTFADELGKIGLVEKVNLQREDGRKGFAFFLPLSKWQVSEDGKTIFPR